MTDERTFKLGDDITSGDIVVDHFGNKFHIVLSQIQRDDLPKPSAWHGQVVADYTDAAMSFLDEMEMLLADEYEIIPDSQEDNWLKNVRKLLTAWRAINNDA